MSFPRILQRICATIFLIGGFVLLTPATADAADPRHTIRDASYHALYMGQSVPDPIVIEAGTTRTVIYRFKNVGTATWNSASTRYISSYTIEPRYRHSVFQGSNWNSHRQTARINGIVRPGEIGELHLELKAPDKPGDYLEEFYLAADGYSWVRGGYFYAEIKVVPPKTNVPNTGAENKVEQDSSTKTENGFAPREEYNAHRIILNQREVSVRGGEDIPVILAFQNVGSATWNEYKVKTYTVPENGVINSVTASMIASDAKVALHKQEILPQWSVAREYVTLTAPTTRGTYQMSVRIAANGQDIEQELGTIRVTVTDNAPNVSGAQDVFVPRLAAEPRIRVGVRTVESTPQSIASLQFISTDDEYRILNNGSEVGILPRNTLVDMTYVGGVYSFDGGGLSFRTNGVIRLEPVTDESAIFTLVNVSRPMAWIGPGDFNRYRGALEYRKGQNDNWLYAVNDLLMEDYVKGIAETSRVDEPEFVKANLIAARTYAYVSRGKYPFFDVMGSTHDQLYLGYNVEVHNVTARNAAIATRGQMVTYNNQVVVTPYFGNSDGNTRSWRSVWGGAERPWLVPVYATYDARDASLLANRKTNCGPMGSTQCGHGVGMSQRDANLRAREERVDYAALIKYYYTGVEIEQMYR